MKTASRNYRGKRNTFWIKIVNFQKKFLEKKEKVAPESSLKSFLISFS